MKHKQVTVIHIDPVTQSIEEVAVDGSLEGYQALVGGLIEACVDLGRGHNIWVNEEAQLLDKPFTRR